jgi:hypothetical protein
MATVILATIRGLLLDLNVTSDHTRVNDALDAFVDFLEQRVGGLSAIVPPLCDAGPDATTELSGD